VWQLYRVSGFVWLAVLNQIGVLSFSFYILLQPLCSVLGCILWMVFLHLLGLVALRALMCIDGLVVSQSPAEGLGLRHSYMHLR
jgi:hypothetical protein